MRIYVAGRFQAYDKVRSVVDRCISAGHSITHDWTRTAEFDPEGHPRSPDGSQSKDALAAHAMDDLDGVYTADLLVLCADDSLAGAWVEMGAALAWGIPVLAIAPERWTIFLELPSVQTIQDYVTLEDALRTYEAALV